LDKENCNFQGKNSAVDWPCQFWNAHLWRTRDACFQCLLGLDYACLEFFKNWFSVLTKVERFTLLWEQVCSSL